MQCIKTGAQIFISQYGEFAICDVFEMDGVYIFRVAGFDREPMRDHVHFEVMDVAQWFDRGTARNSTMVSNRVTHFGPQGKEVIK